MAGWTQAEAAAATAEYRPGTTPDDIGYWERGEREPDADSYVALCVAFDLEEGELREYVAQPVPHERDRIGPEVPA